MSIIHSGGEVIFEDKDWSGIYQLKPYPIYDAAKRLTSVMFPSHDLEGRRKFIKAISSSDPFFVYFLLSTS